MSSCKDALCTFASRKELAEHETNCHPMELQGPFTNRGLFDRLSPGSKGALDPISTPEDSFSCPLCRKDLGPSKRVYISHLAKHMESIALATLPPDPEDMSGDESDLGDQSDESVQDAEENHPREPTPSLFRLNMKVAAREDENNPYNQESYYLQQNIAYHQEDNPYYHNGVMESPTLSDNANDFLDSRGSSPVLFEKPWALPPPTMSPGTTSRTNSTLEYSPSLEHVSEYDEYPDLDLVEPPYAKSGDRVMSKPVQPPAQQRSPGTLASPDGLFKLVGRSDLEFENTARVHPLYHNVAPHADGLYHCPWENKPEANCKHKAEKLKINYEYD
jgi:hypothetical protein